MRLLPGLVLIILFASASSVEARLFWQTYGSTVPTADGCGCAWNWNQDYFVPRYPSSGRYGLFSPCKSSCSSSAACKACHPIHHGYCTIYGPCHYRRRDHVYGAHCGCSPIQLDSGRGCGARPVAGCCHAPGSCGEIGCATTAPLCCELCPSAPLCCELCPPAPLCLELCPPAPLCLELCPPAPPCLELCPSAPLYNVEVAHLDILGSIPVEGGDLLTRTDFSQLGNERGSKLSLPLQETLPLLQGLPSLGLPPSELLQHLPKP